MHSLVGRTGLAVVFAALTACGDDVSGPPAIEGVYQLRLLDGEQLPYDHQGLGCCTYLSGTFRLESGGYEVSITARNRNTGLVFTATEWGTYVHQAALLTFAPDSADVAPLLLDVAAIATDSLRVAFGGEGPGSPDQFQSLFVRSPDQATASAGSRGPAPPQERRREPMITDKPRTASCV